MSRRERTIRALLEALELSGKVEQAVSFQRKFAGRGWEFLTDSDVDDVLSELEGWTKEADTECIEDNDGWSLFSDYRPFIESINGGTGFIESLDSLTRISSFEQACETLKEVFVEHLGLDGWQLDLSGRVGNPGTFLSVRGVASFGDFHVVAAHLKHYVHYSNNLLPVFTLYPFSLLVTFSPGLETVRIGLSSLGSTSNKQFWRSFCGAAKDSVGLEHILAWAKRFDLLHPSMEQDHIDYSSNVAKVLSLKPAELAQLWRSRHLTLSEYGSGISWEDEPTNAVQSFFQMGKDESNRLHWGLNKVLRNSFPIPISRARYTAKLTGHCFDLEASPFDVEDVCKCVFNCETLFVTGRLEIDISSAEGVAIGKETIECRIPVPSKDGVFVIAGEPFVYTPAFGQAKDSPCNSNLFNIESEESAADYEYLPDDSDETIVFETAEENEEEGNGAFSPLEAYNGLTIRGILEAAVAAKLAFFRSVLWCATEDEFETVQSFRARLRPWTDERGLLRIAAENALRRQLQPVDVCSVLQQSFRVIKWAGRPDVPPAWACPEISSSSKECEMYPISGARVHPVDGLSVPNEDEKGYELVCGGEDLLSANRRLNPMTSSLPSDVWIAKQLSAFSQLNPGSLSRAFDCARFGQTIDANPLVRRTSAKARCLLSETSWHKLENQWQLLIVDIPTADEKGEPPEFLVEPGRYLKSDEVWLACSAKNWPSTAHRKHHNLVEVAARLCDKELPKERKVLWRVPSGVNGRVVGAVLAEDRSWNGMLTGWRASLRLSSYSKASWALLPNGSLVEVEPLRPEDAIYNASGDAAELVIEYPGELSAAAVSWKDPISDQTVDVDLLQSSSVLFVSKPEHLKHCTSSSLPRRRLIDGTQLPTHPAEPCLTQAELIYATVVEPKFGALWHYNDRERAAGVPTLSPYLEEILLAANAHSLPAKFSVLPVEKKQVKTRTFWPAVNNVQGNRSEYIDCVTTTKDARLRSDPDKNHKQPLFWSCHCKELTGAHHAFEICNECSEPVRFTSDYQREVVQNVIKLPSAVFHPWYLQATATLLGLTHDELLEMIDSFGVNELIDLARLAKKRPWQAVEKRLADTKDRAIQLELCKGVELLKSICEAGDIEGRLIVSHIGLLPPPLRALHNLYGASRRAYSPIVKHYREIALHSTLSKKLKNCNVPEVQQELSRRLQIIVNNLYGLLDKRPDVAYSSFLSLLERTWPLTRNGSIRTTQQGLRRDAFSSRYSLGRVSSVYYERSTRVAEPSKASYWQERAAGHILEKEYGARLLAILGGLDLITSQVLHCDDYPIGVPVNIDDEASVGRIIARTVFKELRQGHPLALLQLLDRRLPLKLPKNGIVAEKQIVSRLGGFPRGNGEHSLFVKKVLARVLGGWHYGPVSIENPTGWLWQSPASPAVAGFRRALPPLNSLAWYSWPGFYTAAAPTTWLAVDGANECNWTDMLKSLQGWPTTYLDLIEASSAEDIDDKRQEPEEKLSPPMMIVEEIDELPKPPIKVEDDSVYGEEKKGKGGEQIVPLRGTVLDWLGKRE